MIKPLQNIITKSAKQLTKQNVNSACVWVFHQPKLPTKAVQELKQRQ